MDRLREKKQKLHEASARYIDEKKRFESDIRSLKDDLADYQQKIEDVEEKLCKDYDEYDTRTKELSNHVLEQTERIDSLQKELDTVTAANDNTMNLLNTEVSKLCEELKINLEVFERVGAEKEQLESQLEKVRMALVDSEHS